MRQDKIEMWTWGHPAPRRFARQAIQAEELGWDGIVVPESQNLLADPYCAMAIAATQTKTIKMGTGVANCVTRHPASLATSIATVQEESGGRVVLGIGTGDSATAHLGLAPAPLRVLVRYVGRLQGFLRGEEVPFDVEYDGRNGEIPPSEAMGMADGPKTSRLLWLNPAVPKVPVEVAASGPKTIAAGARLADQIAFAVGANVARLEWAIGVAREARSAAGLDPATLPIAAYMPVFAHEDRATARELISGTVASYSHLSVMRGSVVGPAGDNHQKVLKDVRDSYDMNTHQHYGSPMSKVMTEDVLDDFCVAGPPSYCTERLLELSELGISKFICIGYSLDMDPEVARRSRIMLTEQVLPALR